MLQTGEWLLLSELYQIRIVMFFFISDPMTFTPSTAFSTGPIWVNIAIFFEREYGAGTALFILFRSHRWFQKATFRRNYLWFKVLTNQIQSYMIHIAFC